MTSKKLYTEIIKYIEKRKEQWSETKIESNNAYFLDPHVVLENAYDYLIEGLEIEFRDKV